MLHDSYFNLSTIVLQDQYHVILRADFCEFSLLLNRCRLALSFNLDRFYMHLLRLSLVGLTSSSPVFNCHPVVTSRRCLRLTALQGSDNLKIAWCLTVFVRREWYPGGWVEERGNLCDTRIAESIYMYRSVFFVNECEVNKGQWYRSKLRCFDVFS